MPYAIENDPLARQLVVRIEGSITLEDDLPEIPALCSIRSRKSLVKELAKASPTLAPTFTVRVPISVGFRPIMSAESPTRDGTMPETIKYDVTVRFIRLIVVLRSLAIAGIDRENIRLLSVENQA